MEMVARISCLVLAANANGSWVKPVQVEVATASRVGRVGQVAQVAVLMERTFQEVSRGTASFVAEAAQVTALTGTVCQLVLSVMLAFASQGIACRAVKAALQGPVSHDPCGKSMRWDPVTRHLGKPAVELVAAAQVAGAVPQEQLRQAANYHWVNETKSPAVNVSLHLLL